MRRAKVFLLFLLPLLLLSCAKTRTMRADADGFGYTDQKSGVHYTVMPTAYIPVSVGKRFAKSEEGAVLREFYADGELSPEAWLADRYGHLYSADGTSPDVRNAEITTILVCVRETISVEFARVSDAETIAAFKRAWFDGAQAELPPEKPAAVRTLQCVMTEYPAFYYCVTFYRYADGDAYCFDRESGHTVALDEGIADKFVPMEAIR